MQKLIFPILFVLLLASCKTDNKASENTKDNNTNIVFQNGIYTSEEGKFSIKFPEEPEFSEENIDTELGAIRMATYVYEANENKAFMVAYSDYPSMLMSLANKEDLLEGAKEGALASLGITNVTTEKIVEKNGNEGLYFNGDDGDNYHIEYEMYMVENRLYQIAIIESNGKNTAKEDKEFFTSFRLN
jgi:hypothetical protein